MDRFSLSEHEPALAEYALGELEPEEAARVARHLETCAQCREALRRIEEALGWLGAAVPQQVPPPALRARVLAAVAGEERRRWRLAWARGLAAVAAGLLVLALILAVTRADQRLDDLARRQATVAAVLAAADWSTEMRGEVPELPAVVGRVYLARAGRSSVVAFDGLPAPGQGRVYQLWLIRGDGSREDAAVFVPDARGTALLLVEARATWSDYRGMGLTIEPGPGGSLQPTGTRVAGCSWAWENQEPS